MSRCRCSPLALLISVLVLIQCSTPWARATEDLPSAETKDAPQRLSGAGRVELEEHLSPRAIEVIELADRVEIGRLAVASAEEAERLSLRGLDRIAGYPIDGPVGQLDPQGADRVRRALRSPGSHSDVPIRCLNDYFIGVRFYQGDQRVELALGISCQQAIWAFPAGSGVGRWGARLSDGATQALKEALEGVSER